MTLSGSFTISLTEREERILREAAEQKDMSPEAVIKHWLRMGQLMDHYINHGYKPMFHKNVHDVTEVVDPFYTFPKLAPMPFSQDTSHLDSWEGEGGAPVRQLSCGCDVGCCICDIET